MAQEILDFYPGELLNIANICHTIDPCSPMDLETEGPIHFFVINNIDQQKIYLLVLIAEQGGVKKKEEEVIKFLEDNVLSSFRFKK